MLRTEIMRNAAMLRTVACIMSVVSVLVFAAGFVIGKTFGGVSLIAVGGVLLNITLVFTGVLYVINETWMRPKDWRDTGFFILAIGVGCEFIVYSTEIFAEMRPWISFGLIVGLLFVLGSCIYNVFYIGENEGNFNERPFRQSVSCLYAAAVGILVVAIGKGLCGFPLPFHTLTICRNLLIGCVVTRAVIYLMKMWYYNGLNAKYRKEEKLSQEYIRKWVSWYNLFLSSFFIASMSLGIGFATEYTVSCIAGIIAILAVLVCLVSILLLLTLSYVIGVVVFLLEIGIVCMLILPVLGELGIDHMSITSATGQILLITVHIFPLLYLITGVGLLGVSAVSNKEYLAHSLFAGALLSFGVWYGVWTGEKYGVLPFSAEAYRFLWIVAVALFFAGLAVTVVKCLFTK